MVKASEIRDRESLREWLANEPVNFASELALRVCYRVFPVARLDATGRFEDVAELAVLSLLRLLFTLQTYSVDRRQDIAIAADRSDDKLLELSVELAALGAQPAAHACNAASMAASTFGAVEANEKPNAIHCLSDVVSHAANASRVPTDIWIELRNDAMMAERNWRLDQGALWSASAPEWFERADAALRAFWDTVRRQEWKFWERWWDGVQSGERLDRQLQTRVALIENEIWQQGAGAVAREITLIEEQLHLQDEVARLQSALKESRAQVATLPTRSHNNPPELVDQVSELAGELDEASNALLVAGAELARDAPRPAVLRKVGRTLLNAAARTLAYCASLGDAALKKAAEEVGSFGAKAAIGTGLLAWISQWEAVQALGQALEAFAKALGGG